MSAGAPLLSAVGLSRLYAAGRRGARFRAVDRCTFTLHRDETVGLVGESGCGKSTLARLVLGLEPADEGVAQFDGADLAALDNAAWRASRRRMQMVFQDAAGSLDPRLSAGAQVREALEIHRLGDAATRADHAAQALADVKLGAHLWDRFPHELSGGQLQRVVLARALALKPDFLALDEPVAALDVSIQAQIVNLLRELRHRLGLAYLFVSHDLAVVRHVADRVYVMYLGRIVEHGPCAALFAAPRHPYTRALIAAAPFPDPARRRAAPLLSGEPPSPQNPPPGCRFHPRCPLAVARCRAEAPPLEQAGDRAVACWRADAMGAAA